MWKVALGSKEKASHVTGFLMIKKGKTYTTGCRFRPYIDSRARVDGQRSAIDQIHRAQIHTAQLGSSDAEHGVLPFEVQIPREVAPGARGRHVGHPHTRPTSFSETITQETAAQKVSENRHTAVVRIRDRVLTGFLTLHI